MFRLWINQQIHLICDNSSHLSLESYECEEIQFWRMPDVHVHNNATSYIAAVLVGDHIICQDVSYLHVTCFVRALPI